MIPESLRNKLLYELLPRGHAATQTTQLKGQLCALVDMASIDEKVREDLQERFAGRLYPLIVEAGLEALTPLSATLIEAPSPDWEGQHRLMDELSSCYGHVSGDVISVFISSTLSTPALAAHLRQATFVYGYAPRQKIDWDNYGVEQTEEVRYLLRYYDPLITPVLYGKAPEDWQSWFFAPILSWCFMHANAEQEQWHQMIGGARPPGQIPAAPRLMLTEELMTSLAKDPMPYRILNALEQDEQTRFTHDCRGVRTARVKDMLHMAYKQGFSTHAHLLDFVRLGHQHDLNRIIRHPSWGTVKQQVLSGKVSLFDLYQQGNLK